MSSPALVLVDVDHTLSPHSYPRLDMVVYDADRLGRHLIPEALFDDLEDLPATKVWLTSWSQAAEQVFARGWETATGPTKREAAIAAVERTGARRVVWFDDEAAEALPGVQTLAIRPEHGRGLSPGDLERAMEFLNRD